MKAGDVDRFLHAQMDSLGLPALSIAIINNGHIVYQRALGVANLDTRTPIDGNSIFEAASLSKTVFTFFVLKMVDEGLLSLDTPLYRYMPYPDIAADERYKRITARMVLCHTSGFPNWRYFDKVDSSRHIKYGDLYLNFMPGTQFSYSGEGYYYLARVIAHLTGHNLQNLDSLFQKQVVIPLHLGNMWFSGNNYIYTHKVSGHKAGKVFFKKWPTSFPEQDSSWFGAAGGLHTEAVAYARFLIALMDGKGLTAKSLSEMFTAQVQIPETNFSRAQGGDTAWGLGIAIKPVPGRTLYEHGGNNGDFQSGFMINRTLKNGYVFFTNCDKGAIFNERLAGFLDGLGSKNPH